jgi:hypothetical protein
LFLISCLNRILFQFAVALQHGRQDFGHSDVFGKSVGGWMGGMQIAQQAVVIPTLPDFLEPAGADLIAMAPGSDLAADAGIGADIREMVDEAMFRGEQQTAPALEVAQADWIHLAQV